jgi:hypothetical protein
MIKKKSRSRNEDAEFGLDSRYTSDKERESDATALMEARLIRMKNLSKEEIIRAKLVQLKLKMEAYLKDPVYDNRNHFSLFLASYVDTIYPKRTVFAKDIDIAPVSLSQVIHNHRDPKEDFLLKLMVHSDLVYKNVCDFQNQTWYKVYYQEKICDKMSQQKKWRPRIEKHVRLSESIME